ncbi:beta-ketoacyl synthase N-terminal-like domain-containing protein [Amycolatopsis sp. H20-H5]|uniref:beta-ketoacyl synthase N-terminal-like domain-containing protein n=1 Tax=Amycolatopsis sp. H20-H5 TaxID=3046309 RepID=UPI002DB9910D|nr:beta-ketoacyl synthase N-terminal-like domain-containing protein [Amycolatopsis sp. H20-H5]MEC3975505.1 beta-ketoacyl synthase N-terminal-like domain-containing protein [Amycolatopsis sp. H20-H5]
MSSPGPVAIVGMSVLLPAAPDLDTYWRNLVGGVDAISEVPPGKWDGAHYAPDAERRADRIYCRRGGFVDDLAEVDVTGFGIMPNSVPATEPDQLIALHVAAKALADAGGPDRLPADRARVGVILGRGGYLTPGLVRLDQRVRTATQLVRTLGELMPELDFARLEAVRQAFTDQLGPEAPESAIGLVPNLAASRLANRLDLRGPAYTVDAACASSLIAVDHAVRELDSGRCDVVLAGGVHHCHDITFWSVFTQLGALSPSERIRPFHRDADGVLIGEGTGVVVLKRLADAQRDGDRVYAVVTGTGVASDGRTASLASPDSGGQVRAVRQAWAAAGLDPAAPDSLGLLEAHGTATPAGDAAELATLAEVFGQEGSAVLGSVKSMIGHTMPAAGVAGLVKAALAVYHGVLLPTLHCDDPHPALEKTRFSTVDTARPWDAPVRRAGVNAFGFGGINAHVVVEQAPDRAAPVRVHEAERVLRLAAPTAEALREVLSGSDRAVLTAPAGTGPVRLGIVDPTEKRLALARTAVGRGRPWRGRNDVWFVDRPLLGPGGGKLAFVFPGLEAELSLNCGDVARHFGLPWSHSDAAVGDVGRQGAAVFELGRLLEAALRRLGVVPDALAGHSLGEWTAMAAAGMYAPAEIDAFLAGFDPDSLVVPGVAFAVIGAPAPQVHAELNGRADVVLSHDNSPNQAMICGAAVAVEALVTHFREAGIVAQVLPFRSGFHTPMLRPYLGPIREAAERFTLHQPRLPVWSATTVSEYPATEAEVRELFVRHLLEPVRFRLLAEALHTAGFRAFVQVGAGQLGSLISDTLHGKDHLVVAAHSPHRPGLAQLLRVVTALWADGATVDGMALPGQTRAALRKAVKLDLGGHVISLDDRTRAQVGARLRPAQGSTVDVVAGKGSLGAEFAALLQDTADLASTVLGGRAEVPRRLPPPVELNTTLAVSVDAMPYLLDHCFFKQPPQADPGDRWPVVPATTVIDHLMGFAEQAAPGRAAVAVHDVRFNQWITAIPAVTVPVRVVPRGDGVLASLGSYSQAVVELAAAYPADAPAPWRFPASAEEVPETKAAELYDDRWMFHGPCFQGVTELTAVGERHVRAVLTTPAAPGALLDNVGQVLGYWIMARLRERTTVFPVAMREIRFHGPHPAPGERLECLVKITSLTGEFLDADMQLVHKGQVWAEFTGWRDRRFDSNPEIRQADRTPERSTLSKEQPGGWALVHEQWPDLATRELIMRNYLAGPERDVYGARPPRGRRQWLLGRIAAKDAVRQFLWARGEPEMFPAELRIGNDDAGRPLATGAYGRELPPLTISVAHRAEIGVAIARFGLCGIDVEEVAPRTESTVDAAFGTAERALFEAQDGDPELWFARFWTAKEAVAKLRGTGLLGEPRDFEVVTAAPDELTVRVAGRDHHVRCTGTANLPSALPRRYVVAWTEETKETTR